MQSELKSARENARIAVLAPVGTLDHQPGVLNAVQCFLDAGYSVDVFAVRNHYYEAPSLGTATVKYMPISLNTPRDPRLFVTIAYTIWLLLAMRGRYHAVFAGQIRGLVAAWVCSWFRRIRIINLQLELYVGPKADMGFVKIFKWVERRAIRQCWISLIHDEKRASMLAEDAGIDRGSIEIIPNAPLGPSRPFSSTFLQDRLGVRDDTPVLLCPGTIHPNFMSVEICRGAQQLPEEWLCVLHSAQPRTVDEPFIRDVMAENRAARLKLSLEPVPYERIDEVLASATIGLALYSRVGGENTTEVGLASGKLCQFLKLGIPVIVSDYPVLRRFVDEQGVGVAIREAEEIAHAVDVIMQDYEGFRSRAAAAFDEHLAFEKHFGKVLHRLANASD